MTKRTRDTFLTREQLEAGDYGEEADQEAPAAADMGAMGAIGQRKIVKVKRHIQQTGEVKSEVPTKPAQFKLAGSLSSTGAPNSANASAGAKPSFSFAPAAAPAQKVEVKEVAAAEEKPKNLFGSAGTTKFGVVTGGTFAGVDIAAKKPAATLFGNGAAAPSGGLFGAKPAGEPMFKPISGGTFGGKPLPVAAPAQPEKKEEETPKPATLFGSAPAAPGSLFGNLNTVKAPESDPAKPKSLFGGANPVPAPAGQKFGLFGATAKADDSSKDGEKKTSLFGSSAPSGSLFGGGAAATSGGLFGAKPPTGGSLFGGAPAAPGGGLFGNANAGSALFTPFGQGAAKKDADKDDEDDNNSEEEGEKSPPIYADSAKIEFKGAGAQTIKPSPYTKLFEKRVGTFKIVKPEDQAKKISECEISIEFAETNGKKVYLVVVRCAKKVMFQSTISAKMSRCRRVEEKSAKNQIKFCVQQVIEAKPAPAAQATRKISFPFCVINFSRQEEMANFETEFKKGMEALKAETAK